MTEPPAPANNRADDLGRIATIIVMGVVILGVAWLLLTLSSFLMLVFAALVLAAIFDVMTRFVSRITKLKRGPSLAISVIALLGVFASVFTLFGSQLADEFDTIRESIPPAIEEVRGLLDRVGLGKPARDLLDQGGGDISALASQAGSYALTAGNGIANLVLVFVGAIFVASDPGVYRRGLLLLIPSRAEDTAAAGLDDAAHGLRGWMVGQAVSSLVVAAVTWIGLALLGVPASGGLGLIAGLLDVIPMVGPIIAGVPAVLLAFTVSPTTALWTVVLFLVVQQLQGNLLQPMIQKHAVDVPPAILLFAVVAAGLLFGFIGVLLAAPLTVVVFVLVQRVYVRTLLGKDIKVAGRD
ncbi:AI-2E family transporter [Polymorphobacter fuscus]|uniref:AI-2E family transporter n=1 Tax=Sandarakinorhabdus fusca TaxID=1439888 RepID=A0A7C9GSW4_9SPHN|nr:AI-2E family transporter [Polymorphobacter fuscus]KAB7644888.1 AI-2E family transporter [Polymorphobacter fuscus]MQT18171.1 AI-2E family transporter [Polymorphobacter fuscus]NJC09490.1 putative PurR-regulated permease PerM [Polymorphobacter fuscus]